MILDQEMRKRSCLPSIWSNKVVSSPWHSSRTLDEREAFTGTTMEENDEHSSTGTLSIHEGILGAFGVAWRQLRWEARVWRRLRRDSMLRHCNPRIGSATPCIYTLPCPVSAILYSAPLIGWFSHHAGLRWNEGA